MAQKHKLQHLPSSPCPLNKLSSFGESSTSSNTEEDELSSSSDDERIIDDKNIVKSLPTLPDLKNKSNTKESLSSSSSSNTMNNYFYLIICALGICICYLSCGFINERLYSMPSVKQAGPISSFVVMTQTFTNFIVAFIWKFYNDSNNVDCNTANRKNEKVGVLNHKLFFATSFCYFAAMTLTNESLNYVSYPTATLAKSSKIIPNMLMGYLIEHKSYATIEYVGTAFITVGIVGFNLSRMDNANKSSGQQDSSYGLMLLFLSLTMDGILGSFQNMLKKESSSSSKNSKNTDNDNKIYYRKPTAMETMLCMNFYAFVFLLPTSCIFTPHLKNGITLLLDTKLSSSSSSFLSLLLYLNGSAALGQIFIFVTITKFSPLVCTIITTTRKFITILLSVLYFGHVFTFVQWFFTIVIFTGIYLEIFCCDHIVVVNSSDKKKKIL